MKTSYYLAIAAVLAAVGGAVYTGLRAATPTPAPNVPLTPLPVVRPADDMPSLPPVVLDPKAVVPKVLAEPPKAATPPAPLPPPPGLPKIAPVPPSVPAAPLPNVPPPGLPKIAPTLPPVPPPANLPAVPMPMPTPAPPTPPPVPLPDVPPPTVARKPSPSTTPLPVPTPLVTPAPPSAGQFVLLTDHKLVEGIVTKTDGKVYVRKGVVNQPYPADKVQFVGESKDEVYHFQLKQLKPDDAPGRFKLARWCMFNGMREQALAEARAVVKLQPNHSAAAEMERALDESLRLFPPEGVPAPSATPAPASGLPAVPPPAAPTPPAVQEPEPSVPPEAAITFGSRVQPILTNLCAGCHAKPTYAGEFQLSAAPAGLDQNPTATRRNLLAAVKQIKNTNPAASPLLVKTLSIHGEMKQPAVNGRHVLAFRTLEAWVFLAAGTPAAPPVPNPVAPVAPAKEPEAAQPLAAPLPPPSVPMLEEKPVLPVVPSPLPEVKPLPLPPPPTIPPAADVKPLPPPIPPATAAKFGQDAKPLPVSTPPNPASTSAAVDEFDPSVFNRLMQSKPPVAAAR